MSDHYKVLDELIEDGEIDPKDREFHERIIRVNGFLAKKIKEIDAATDPYLTPTSLPSDIVVHHNAEPKFFRQMSEDELTRDFVVPEFKPSLSGHSSVDYCYTLRQQIGSTLWNTFHRRDKYVSLGDYTGSRVPDLESGRKRVLLEYEQPNNRDTRYEWSTTSIDAYKDKPHLLVGAYHYTKYNDVTRYILRSELLILLRCMRWKGRLDSSLQDAIIPTLLISIRPRHIRVIECYFDGVQIHVNYGSPIFFESDTPVKDQQKRAESILRWLASTPQGNTKSFSSVRT